MQLITYIKYESWRLLSSSTSLNNKKEPGWEWKHNILSLTSLCHTCTLTTQWSRASIQVRPPPQQLDADGLPSGRGFGLSRPPSCMSSKAKDTLWTCEEHETRGVVSESAFSAQISRRPSAASNPATLQMSRLQKHSEASEADLFSCDFNKCFPGGGGSCGSDSAAPPMGRWEKMCVFFQTVVSYL